MHLLLMLLLQRLRRPGWKQRFPLLQQHLWPRHGVNRLLCILHSSITLFWGCAILYTEGGLGGVFSSRAAAAAAAAAGDGDAAAAAAGAAAPWGCGVPKYFGGDMSSLQRALLLHSFAFFLYDILYVCFEGDLPTTLHHLGAVCAIGYSFIRGAAGAELVAGLTVGECSTPLLHLRYFARHFAAATAEQQQKEQEGPPRKQDGAPDAASIAGDEDSGVRTPCGVFGVSFAALTRAAELGFVFVFITARAIGGTALTAATCWCSSTPLPIKAMASLVCLISYFWIGQILLLVHRRGSAGRERRKKTA